MNHWGNQKLPIDKRKWKHNQPKPMGHSRSSSKMIYSNKGYLRKQKQTNKQQTNPQINNLTLQLNQPEKEEQIKPKISRRKEIRGQSRNKWNREWKKAIENINETKADSLKRWTKLINL